MKNRIAIIVVPLLLSAVAAINCQQQVNDDTSTDEWIFRATELPADVKTYATIGNGHVATVVHRDSVFMNGVYSGERGFSHRARIPTRNNIKVVAAQGTPPTNQIYELNVRQGYYSERFSLQGYNIEIRTYAHQYYHTVIVSQIIVTRDSAPGNILLNITNDTGNESSDFDFQMVSRPELNATQYCGPVRQLEDKAYQNEANPPGACVLTKNLPGASVDISATTTLWYFTSYARDSPVATREYMEVQSHIDRLPIEFFERHTSAWQTLWTQSSIQVVGNLNISKVINGALYYLLSSLPITTETLNPVGQFYGLSPGSLSFGAHNESIPDLIARPMDYQGHSFWDTETWMFPPILFFYPDKAQQLLNYRMNNVRAARDRAVKSGYRGARFPWESGLTGREVTPDCCEETRDLQIHVSADIMYAMRQYIALTRDVDWLKAQNPNYVTNACGLVREVADFFASRTCYNENGFYDIKGVMPPDEDNYNDTSNNGYTNVMAGYAIFFAKYAECLCGTSMPDPIPEHWLEIARSLRFLYDEENDYHPEFEAFNLTNAKEIKQADVVLLGYPVMYEMEPSTRANDLRIYEGLTRPDGPAMTWAMHTVGWLDLGNTTNAAAMFAKSYSSYMRQPFKTWTEAIYPNSGAHNFITGMGGFLQSIINGYAGLRLHPEELEFRNPRVLPDSTSLRLIGVKYLDYALNIVITPGKAEIMLTQALTPNPKPLILEHNGQNNTLALDSMVEIDTSGGNVVFRIFTSTLTNCPLPEDRISVNRNTPTPTTTTTTPNPSTTTTGTTTTTTGNEPAASSRLSTTGILIYAFITIFARYYF